MLLAIDTATSLAGIACWDETGLLAECTWYAQRHHTAQVLPQLELLTKHLRKTPSDMRAIGVSLGPGSWSGLRVGLSMAKGLAIAGALPIIGVGTLDALAYQYQRPFLSVFPVIRLGRDRFATAEFVTATEWRRVSDYRNVSIDELCRGVTEQALFCGDIDPQLQEAIRQRLPTQALFPSPPAAPRRAGFLAALAWQRFVANDWDDVHRLEPIYLGEPLQSTEPRDNPQKDHHEEHDVCTQSI